MTNAAPLPARFAQTRIDYAVTYFVAALRELSLPGGRYCSGPDAVRVAAELHGLALR